MSTGTIRWSEDNDIWNLNGVIFSPAIGTSDYPRGILGPLDSQQVIVVPLDAASTRRRNVAPAPVHRYAFPVEIKLVEDDDLFSAILVAANDSNVEWTEDNDVSASQALGSWYTTMRFDLTTTPNKELEKLEELEELEEFMAVLLLAA